MAESTHISWADATFNPWIGCVEVSPACDHCYARSLVTGRMGLQVWGKDAPRQRTSENYWKQALKWNREAQESGIRRRVFCGSLCDVMEDRSELVPIRHDLARLIERTESLDWLLLTKRPQNFQRFLPKPWLETPRPNVWGMTTVESPEYLWRIKALRETPFAVRGLSMEPLLAMFEPFFTDGIHWIIGGGESGGEARPTHPAWALRLKKIAKLGATAFHWKQWGCWFPVCDYYADGERRERSLDEPHVLLTENGLQWRAPDGKCINDGQPPPGTWIMRRMAKEKAGRLLNGLLWNEVPEPRP